VYKKQTINYYFKLTELINESVKKKDTIIISINGAPGSGKSTLALWLKNEVKRNNLSSIIIPTDDYMCMPRGERLFSGVSGLQNKAYATNLLFQHIHLLSKIPPNTEKNIRFPRYRSESGLFYQQSRMVKFKNLLIIEGLMSFLPVLHEMIDVYVWLETPIAHRVKLRVDVDVERGYDKAQRNLSLALHERDWPEFEKKQYNFMRRGVSGGKAVFRAEWDDVRDC